MDRIWLDVPFEEKDQAKAAGAKWDPAARCWYAPRPGMADLEPWTAAAPLPDLLPGEDRTLGPGLFVDMVPSTCWFTNVRSCVAPRDWERIRRMVTARAGQRCETCGAPEDRAARRWLEVHERWAYDEATQVQRLGRLICLCSDCHTATHYGLAGIRGRSSAARSHLQKVTGLGASDISILIEVATETFYRRSTHPWTLDLSILTDTGVTVTPPPSAQDRPAAAREGLYRESRKRW
ncbi:hypothetical protein KIH74_33120 [Kineosporia sp. J2-2]|uniref:DUF5710 domain-containing protein n=1 Tax=Kineosporia corallincola TaxID=2835133 RepID=A0ABS5TSQ4_9ACTN|nr:DUF5710 domain-containing protein [Kineosporia corallincola]MBT0773834.1 hypothetical protein [Kineosporia corallincola]